MDRRSLIRGGMVAGAIEFLPRSDAQLKASSAPYFSAIRVARTTNKLDEIARFYGKGVGLPVIGRFENHSGYSGIMFGTPTDAFHLEFTHADAGSPAVVTSADDLLVLYMSDDSIYQQSVKRLTGLGYQTVSPENPYWKDASTVFLDPDGWHLVLHQGPAFGPPR